MRTQLAMIMMIISLCSPALADEGMPVFKTDSKNTEVHADSTFRENSDKSANLKISSENHTVTIAKDERSQQKESAQPSGETVREEPGMDKTENKDSLNFNFVRIEPGSFEMGSNSGSDDKRPVHTIYGGYGGMTDANRETGSNDEKPVHTVILTRPFEISDHEVTVGEYRKFVESTGYEPPTKTGSKGLYSYDGDCNWNKKNVEDHPVNCVSWEDAQSFISWLNMQSGKNRYRLPTEAEWEYAARAGTKTEWACGNGEWCLIQIGWFYGNSGGKTHPVKTKMPNEWKLYDMHGNVWEWVQDWYDSEYYANSPEKDPLNSSPGTFRVRRGGSWRNPARHCRCAYRVYDSPGERFDNVGFRIVLSPDQQ